MNLIAAGNLETILSVCNMLVSTLITIGLFYVASKANKIDKLEDQLRKASTEAADLRFGALSAELTGTIGQLRAVVGEIQRRLERGDDQFDRNNQDQHKLELKTLQLISELRNSCASKEDLHAIQEQLSRLQLDVNRISVACHRCNYPQKAELN